MPLVGHILLQAEPRPGGATVLGRQSFTAPFHLSKPYLDPETSVLVVQVVNPTAGILRGDRLRSDVVVKAGARLLVTSPSSSRVFRMESGDAAAETTYTIESGGWLEVLPEPLVLHAGSRFFQGTRIRVEAGAAAFIAEMVLPGRLARGEYAAWDRLRLRTALESQGRVVLRESLDLTGPEFAELARVCGGSAQAAFGTALLVEPTPGNARPSWLDAVDRLHREGNWIGASRIAPEGWVFKFVSPDGEHLRRQLAGLRNALVEAYPWLRCDPRTRTTSQIQIPPPAPSAHR